MGICSTKNVEWNVLRCLLFNEHWIDWKAVARLGDVCHTLRKATTAKGALHVPKFVSFGSNFSDTSLESLAAQAHVDFRSFVEVDFSECEHLQLRKIITFVKKCGGLATLHVRTTHPFMTEHTPLGRDDLRHVYQDNINILRRKTATLFVTTIGGFFDPYHRWHVMYKKDGMCNLSKDEYVYFHRKYLSEIGDPVRYWKWLQTWVDLRYRRKIVNPPASTGVWPRLCAGGVGTRDGEVELSRSGQIAVLWEYNGTGPPIEAIQLRRKHPKSRKCLLSW